MRKREKNKKKIDTLREREDEKKSEKLKENIFLPPSLEPCGL